MKYSFPKDFLFGAASSACQIEAGCHIDGKGEDVGEHYYKLYPEKYFGADPDKAADFYHRYPEDILDMRRLGLKCFRFSISWSRIYPCGPEKVNERGLRYYRDVAQKLKEAGIKVFFDLFHCDLPFWVIEAGGILDKRFISWFSDYARTCFAYLGDLVDYWSTVNEPSINCFGAYAYGTNAPFLKDMSLAIKASHNMILAHYAAIRIYKETGFSGQIGSVIHFEPVYPASDSEEDALAAARKRDFYSGWWLDPMLTGKYPAALVKTPYIAEMMPAGYERELADNFVPNDFIAVNYYSPALAAFDPEKPLGYRSVDPELPRDDYGFFRYPQGIFDTVTYLNATYPGKNIFISENGIGVLRTGEKEKDLHDGYRVDYLREHLRALSRAIGAGAPVKGYFHWTIMDTNELYAGGYKYLFGLTQVDFDTLERTPRDSWYVYRDIIADGGLDG